MSAIKIGNYYLTKDDPRFLLKKVAELSDKNQEYKEVLSKVKNKIEAKIAFCSCESKGHINHEKCDKTILFLRGLLEDLKEVE